MNVIVTTFQNPFSFFCINGDLAVKADNNIVLPENNGPLANKINFSGASHGQYVAVLWNNAWARGIISLEAQFLIWLIDYGTYLRPTEKTVYVTLPPEYKKYPTKVFEASIHGVTPVDKVLNDMCQIENEISTSWKRGAVEKAKELIANATKTYFIPIALMSTKNNDVVLGDLYLKKGKETVNLADELEQWPVFLEKDPEIYIEKLSKFYTNRRQHRACSLKPVFPMKDLPTITPATTLGEYVAICADSPRLEVESEDDSEEGSTITYIENPTPTNHAFKLTPAEIEKYANVYITVSGQEYNVLNVLLNKARDLYMCEKFKDLKSIGRATSRWSRFTDTD